MLADHETNPFRPRPGDSVHGGYLTSAGGSTLMSLGDNGVMARSTDGGASWLRAWLNIDSYGPGGAAATPFARSEDVLYVGVDTGGVQGSRTRTALSRSTDGGGDVRRTRPAPARSARRRRPGR
jgi:hypothetical protein